MTRLGPLTSQALGRSPYDDVIPGEGLADPGEPEHVYDDRGRPVNPESRRFNRDIIRAHNEVMLVVGVAEPENGIPEAHAEFLRTFQSYEEWMGNGLYRVGRAMTGCVYWGLNGMRQRIMIYNRYASIPFLNLIKYERTLQSRLKYLTVGLPAYAVECAIVYLLESPQLTFWNYWTPRQLQWVNTAILYIFLHHRAFDEMQRAGAIPAYPWFPSFGFYVPFSASSPIQPVGLPFSWTPRGILCWAAKVGVALAPAAVFLLHDLVSAAVNEFLYEKIWNMIPRPRASRKAICSNAEHNHAIPEPEPLVEVVREDSNNNNTDGEGRHAQNGANVDAAADAGEDGQGAQEGEAQEEVRTTSDPHPRTGGLRYHYSENDTDDPTDDNDDEDPHDGRDVDNHGNRRPDSPTPGLLRRRSTFSSGDGYDMGDMMTDDEDDGAGMMNTTLISFDVEATEASDTPPGVWSAELRPNPSGQHGDGGHGGGDGHPGGGDGVEEEETKYRISLLTLMPGRLGTRMWAHFGSRVVAAPLEGLYLRLMAASFLRRAGVGVTGGWTGLRVAGGVAGAGGLDLGGLGLGAFGAGGGAVASGLAVTAGTGLFSRVGWRLLGNYLGVDLVHFMVCSEVFLTVTGLALVVTQSEEEWWKEQQEEFGGGD